MFVHRSNRLTDLVDHLGELLRSPTPGEGSPHFGRLLEREQILIQSSGMQRYLAQELSLRLGVTFGLEFPYPRLFVQRVVDQVLGPAPEQSAYERGALAFHIFRELPRLGHPEVERFLANDPLGEERLSLSERLANLFDQYIVYRPRLLEAWEKSAVEPQDFQGLLWRRLRLELGPNHFASRVRTLLGAPPQDLKSALPRRLFLVGGAGLPPLFLSVLARFGQVTEVHLLSFTVSSEYFADAHPLEGEFPELGQGVHPLLVKLGRIGADYQALLEAVGYQDGLQQFTPPRSGSLLHELQRDILECRVRGEDQKLSRLALRDGSIQVLSAHSRAREVEALRDHLLALFEKDSTLSAQDVAVLTTDMTAYAPVIRSVFASTLDGSSALPFRISDESERSVSAAVDALLRALELVRGRFKARSVLDLLQTEPVRRKFSLDGAAFEQIVGWVTGAEVRWGLDAEQRALFGMGDFSLNTWKFGLKRLLLGLATGPSAPEFESVVPYDEVELSDAPLVGRLIEFVEILAEAQRELSRPRPVADFCRVVRALSLRLLADADEEVGSIEPILRALGALEERAKVAHLEEALSSLSLSRILEADLVALKSTESFLAGGITFCELLPLRTIPFRVVCVLGLGQADFPRQDKLSSLDRMAERPMRGDRTLRGDDRYLFLELLVATQDHLLLSFVGRSIQDNSSKPPSVVVLELIQVLEQMVEGSGSGATLPVYVHPLEPYSERYFTQGSELRSFSDVYFRAASAKRGMPKLALPRVKACSEPPPVLVQSVGLSDLESFFKNPSRAFLRRLGVDLEGVSADVEDREPVSLTELEKFAIGTAALRAALHGFAHDFDREVAQGSFPMGAPGQLFRAQIEVEVAALHTVVKELVHDARRCEFAIDLEISGSRLEGRIDDLYGTRQLVVAYGRADPKRKWTLWVRHLALLASGISGRSFLVTRDKTAPQVCSFASFPEAMARVYLSEILEVYAQTQNAPIRFDLVAGFAAGEAALRARRSEEAPSLEAVREAANKALGSKGPGRDRRDLSLIYLWGEDDPLGVAGAGVQGETPEFVALTERLIRPLLEHLEDDIEVTEPST